MFGAWRGRSDAGEGFDAEEHEMSPHHANRLDRATAERLLRGGVVDPQRGPDTVARLLAAARGPGRSAEYAGEQIAMDAFRAAHPGLLVEPRKRSAREWALAKISSLRVAVVAAVAVAATGGVAMAATGGALPNPLGGNTPQVQPTPGQVTATPAATAGAKVTESPSPSLVGLCRAYTAGVSDNPGAGGNPGKALDNPAFGVLISAAGGRDRVAAYCDAVLAAAPGPDRTPPVPGGPGNGPDGTPAHPTGKSDKSPKGPLSTRPTGRPDPTGQPGEPAQQTDSPASRSKER